MVDLEFANCIVRFAENNLTNLMGMGRSWGGVGWGWGWGC